MSDSEMIVWGQSGSSMAFLPVRDWNSCIDSRTVGQVGMIEDVVLRGVRSKDQRCCLNN